MAAIPVGAIQPNARDRVCADVVPQSEVHAGVVRVTDLVDLIPRELASASSVRIAMVQPRGERVFDIPARRRQLQVRHRVVGLEPVGVIDLAANGDLTTGDEPHRAVHETPKRLSTDAERAAQVGRLLVCRLHIFELRGAPHGLRIRAPHENLAGRCIDPQAPTLDRSKHVGSPSRQLQMSHTLDNITGGMVGQ